MSIELSMVVPHVPSICHEEKAPDFQRGIIEAMKKVSQQIDEIKPDVIVLISCHWQTTFDHYVNCNPVHQGSVTAHEAANLIGNVPYNYQGDPELAEQIVKAGREAGIPVEGVRDVTFEWDYGTLVPLRYLVPNEDIPIVNISVTLCASLEETNRLGQVIANILKESDKKAVFVASGALAHNLVRGRHHMPTLSEHALNKEFVDLVMKKDFAKAYEMLPQFSALAKVESGGRHLAMLFALLDEECTPVYYADAQSSGSWNPVITFEPAKLAARKEKGEQAAVK